jgi:hypothetical protein
MERETALEQTQQASGVLSALLQRKPMRQKPEAEESVVPDQADVQSQAKYLQSLSSNSFMATPSQPFVRN